MCLFVCEEYDVRSVLVDVIIGLPLELSHARYDDLKPDAQRRIELLGK